MRVLAMNKQRIELKHLISNGGRCVPEWMDRVPECVVNLGAHSLQYRLYYNKLNHYLNEITYFLEKNSTTLINRILRLE